MDHKEILEMMLANTCPADQYVKEGRKISVYWFDCCCVEFEIHFVSLAINNEGQDKFEYEILYFAPAKYNERGCTVRTEL